MTAAVLKSADLSWIGTWKPPLLLPRCEWLWARSLFFASIFFFFLVCKIVVMESSTTWGCVRSEWKVNYLVYTISTQVILAVVITVSPAFKKYYLALWLTHDNVRVYGVQHVDLISRNLSLAAFFLSHQLHVLPLSPEHGRPRLPPCFH